VLITQFLFDFSNQVTSFTEAKSTKDRARQKAATHHRETIAPTVKIHVKGFSKDALLNRFAIVFFVGS
jgi:hypothetical protein